MVELRAIRAELGHQAADNPKHQGAARLGEPGPEHRAQDELKDLKLFIVTVRTPLLHTGYVAILLTMMLLINYIHHIHYWWETNCHTISMTAGVISRT